MAKMFGEEGRGGIASGVLPERSPARLHHVVGRDGDEGFEVLRVSLAGMEGKGEVLPVFSAGWAARGYLFAELPRKGSSKGKWRFVYAALRRGVEPPAVKLLKVGDAYFVRDGNHRASAARRLGVEALDAEVDELRAADGERSDRSTHAPHARCGRS